MLVLYHLPHSICSGIGAIIGGLRKAWAGYELGV